MFARIFEHNGKQILLYKSIFLEQGRQIPGITVAFEHPILGIVTADADLLHEDGPPPSVDVLEMQRDAAFDGITDKTVLEIVATVNRQLDSQLADEARELH